MARAAEHRRRYGGVTVHRVGALGAGVEAGREWLVSVPSLGRHRALGRRAGGGMRIADTCCRCWGVTWSSGRHAGGVVWEPACALPSSVRATGRARPSNKRVLLTNANDRCGDGGAFATFSLTEREHPADIGARVRSRRETLDDSGVFSSCRIHLVRTLSCADRSSSISAIRRCRVLYG